MSADSLQLQPRDIEALHGLFESRVMAIGHLAAIHFGGKREYAKKRLRQLKAAGYVGERRRNANEPSALYLTRKGHAALRAERDLSAYPALGANSFEARANVSPLTLRHELEVMDVKAAFHSALAGPGRFAVGEFSTWPALHQFEVARSGHGGDVLVRPDGFMSIHEAEAGTRGHLHECFLEVDRSTEALDALAGRVGAYLDHYKSGGFALTRGGTRDQFLEYPFRVLIVFKSAERRNNMAERLLLGTPRVLTLAWLSTAAEAVRDPLGPIWLRPLDYREATRGTAFDPDSWAGRREYRRQSVREDFVEVNAKKRALLSEP